MRLICPCCGALVSAEAFRNETTVRQFIGVLEQLPGRVRDLALPYLGLFRRAGGRDAGACGSRGLAWPRALRILADLKALVEPGTVHWEGGEERPCPPHVWAAALDAVLARRPKALENHNYLRRVAWEEAEKLAAHVERGREQQRRQGGPRGEEAVEWREGGADPDADPADRELTREEKREFFKQFNETLKGIGEGGRR